VDLGADAQWLRRVLRVPAADVRSLLQRRVHGVRDNHDHDGPARAAVRRDVRVLVAAGRGPVQVCAQQLYAPVRVRMHAANRGGRPLPGGVHRLLR
jgi:hypothetical protein